MFWIYNLILILYLLISNIAIIVRLYRSFLKYLTPVKGYLASLALIVSLIAVDYFVYSITLRDLNEQTLTQSQSMSYQINTTLSR